MNSIKIGIIGDSYVGKTNLIHRYLDDRFIGDYISGVGIDFDTADFKANEKTYRFQIWEFIGSKRISHSFFRGIQGLLLVYDISDPKSFENLTDWVSEILKNLEYQNYILGIIGNKIDLRPLKNNTTSISRSQGREFLKKVKEESNIPSFFLETSAKSGENVTLAFTQLFKEVITKLPDVKPLE